MSLARGGTATGSRMTRGVWPVPGTSREQLWLAAGAAAGLGIGIAYCRRSREPPAVHSGRGWAKGTSGGGDSEGGAVAAVAPAASQPAVPPAGLSVDARASEAVDPEDHQVAAGPVSDCRAAEVSADACA